MKKIFFVITVAALMGFACSDNTGTQAAANTDLSNETPTEEVDDYVQIQDDATEAAAMNAAKVETPSNDGKVAKMDKAKFQKYVWDYNTNPQAWVYKGTKPMIIDFYADWCGPCKRVAPIMDELAKDYKDEINIYKIDTDVERELAGVFGIQSIPSILFIPADGKPTIIPGAYPKDKYLELIQQYLQVSK